MRKRSMRKRSARKRSVRKRLIYDGTHEEIVINGANGGYLSELQIADFKYILRNDPNSIKMIFYDNKAYSNIEYEFSVSTRSSLI